jgi:uncharacterized membrane protein
MTTSRDTVWTMLIGGVLALFAAFQLTVEKIALLSDPNYQLACDINPVVSCGSVIVTEQASVFGFPNPILGLCGFSVVITLAVLLLAKVELPRWVWLGLNAGALAGLVFVGWLVSQSLYSIGALCPWCMVVWSCTIPIFWLVTAENIRRGRFSRSGDPDAALGVVASTVVSLRWLLVAATYLLIGGLIFVRWMDFWLGG